MQGPCIAGGAAGQWGADHSTGQRSNNVATAAPASARTWALLTAGKKPASNARNSTSECLMVQCLWAARERRWRWSHSSDEQSGQLAHKSELISRV